MSAHESFSDHHGPTPSSNRSFGFTIGAVLVVFAVVPLLRGGSVRLWLVAVALVLAIVAAAAPQMLAVPNRLWTAFGVLLARIVNPIVMAVIFLLLFAPLAIVMRLAKRDALRLRPDPDGKTYWQPRESRQTPASLRQQF